VEIKSKNYGNAEAWLSSYLEITVGVCVDVRL